MNDDLWPAGIDPYHRLEPRTGFVVLDCPRRLIPLLPFECRELAACAEDRPRLQSVLRAAAEEAERQALVLDEAMA